MSESQSQSKREIVDALMKRYNGTTPELQRSQWMRRTVKELTELLARQSKAQPKAASTKKAPMGPSGYRIKFGSSDQLVMDAVRAQWPTITFDDDDILGSIGWAITPKTAVAKVRSLIES